MTYYITSCFSDWQSDTFERGIMAIVNGKRSERQVRRVLQGTDLEGVTWYRKSDPDFAALTYSRCHRTLRQALGLGDALFFRTLWRHKPYILGYFTIAGIVSPGNDPVILAKRDSSPLIHFRLPITPPLVKLLNSRASAVRDRHPNRWTNEWLGRNWMRLSNPAGAYLQALVDDLTASPAL